MTRRKFALPVAVPDRSLDTSNSKIAPCQSNCSNTTLSSFRLSDVIRRSAKSLFGKLEMMLLGRFGL